MPTGKRRKYHGTQLSMKSPSPICLAKDFAASIELPIAPDSATTTNSRTSRLVPTALVRNQVLFRVLLLFAYISARRR